MNIQLSIDFLYVNINQKTILGVENMKEYNFDKIVNRKGSNCIKWDQLKQTYGDDDLIPLWIADMDYEVAPEIVEAIKQRIEHQIYGYTFIPDSYYNAAINWFQKRFQWTVKKEWFEFAPGVVPGINIIIGAYTKPGDDVIIQTPVYHPFAKLIKDNGCSVIENPLKRNGNRYEMDFENLEKVITPRTRLMILCSPHNPVGRVWTKEELKKLGEICIKHNILIVSDEIHADIVYKPNTHTVFSSINEEFAQNSIVCTAPNKTFNIAGFKTANIIIPNEKLRKEYQIQADKLCIQGGSVPGDIAQEAAYSKGESWYQELMKYLDKNLEFSIDFFEKRIPKIKVIPPEGTYLLWLDCEELNMNENQLNNFFIKECKILLNEGIIFGKESKLFQRMNIATSKKVLQEALERIEKAVNKL